jgi:hypothetical protein
MILDSINRIDIRTLTFEAPEASSRTPDIAREINPELWEAVADSIRECYERADYDDLLAITYTASLLDPKKPEELGFSNAMKKDLIDHIYLHLTTINAGVLSGSVSIENLISLGRNVRMVRQVAPEFSHRIPNTVLPKINELIKDDLAGAAAPIMTMDKLMKQLAAIDNARLSNLLSLEEIKKIADQLNFIAERAREGSKLHSPEEAGDLISQFRLCFPEHFDMIQLDPSVLENLHGNVAERLSVLPEALDENLDNRHSDIQFVLQQAADYRILAAETVEVKNGVLVIDMAAYKLPESESLPAERTF